jgi:Ca2+-binding EF-hand superfamily protein
LTKLPSKEEIQNLSKAYNENPKLIGSISKKVIVTTMKEINQEVLTKEQNNLLRLLDYAVNLVF